ncbi:AAA family ATPase [Alkaliphilus pronyensis]|uniref:AAA family ATPase n=1 Tax=Alkaliphilus pronyensis TaxID=1482732 RepID=A0A6I0FFS9_9FIRM|nr:AAA family ATPase [Alkaliphilus pronyensis]KAB3537228.1 AAA family ATPase [Alkaliphilus pronyensis]
MKLKLAIVDTDLDYLNALENYLMNSFSQRFQVSFFTQPDYLLKELKKEDSKIDILLINSQLYCDTLSKKNIGIVILLIEELLTTSLDNLPCVKKYQPGNQLMANLINIYVDAFPNQFLKPNKNGNTSVIGVYSPVGGSGKSTVAILTAYALAQEGKRVFYLNLENIPSICSFIDCTPSHNMSNLFYYLRNKKKNLLLKIEGIRQLDIGLGVYYFPPIEKLTDLEEVTSEELIYLIKELKNSNQYDYIIIDFDSTYNRDKRNQMNVCDKLLLVLNQTTVTNVKASILIKELERLSLEEDSISLENIYMIINKAKSPIDISNRQFTINNNEEVYLPYIQINSHNKIIDNKAFLQPLIQLVRRL